MSHLRSCSLMPHASGHFSLPSILFRLQSCRIRCIYVWFTYAFVAALPFAHVDRVQYSRLSPTLALLDKTRSLRPFRTCALHPYARTSCTGKWPYPVDKKHPAQKNSLQVVGFIASRLGGACCPQVMLNSRGGVENSPVVARPL